MKYDNLEAVEKCVITEMEKLEETIAIEEIDQDTDRVKKLALHIKDALEKEEGRELIDYSLIELAAEYGSLDTIKQFNKELNEK